MEEKIMRVAVTGAARGIGAATARLLMQRGWRVACLDRDLDAARQIAGDHPAIAVDVAEEELVIGAFAKVREALGGLDALATCAGIFETTPFFETTAKTFRRVHDVNVIGTFLSLREAVGMMQPGARICTVASVAGLRGGGLSGTISYASSKGAILALTKNAARMLGPRGIAVNTIAPGVDRYALRRRRLGRARHAPAPGGAHLLQPARHRRGDRRGHRLAALAGGLLCAWGDARRRRRDGDVLRGPARPGRGRDAPCCQALWPALPPTGSGIEKSAAVRGAAGGSAVSTSGAGAASGIAVSGSTSIWPEMMPPRAISIRP